MLLKCLLTFVDNTRTALAFCVISRARIWAKPPPPAIAMRMVMATCVGMPQDADHVAWEDLAEEEEPCAES